MSDDQKVELRIEASVTENRMQFRMAGGTAELEDGRKVEVAQPMSGNGILITITNVDKTWRTYFLEMHALAHAALAAEQEFALQKALNLYTPKPGDCICWKCLEGKNVAMMVLCPTCGNKRCPKASDHEFACTGSNEPGQPGSVYAEQTNEDTGQPAAAGDVPERDTSQPLRGDGTD